MDYATVECIHPSFGPPLAVLEMVRAVEWWQLWDEIAEQLNQVVTIHLHSGFVHPFDT